MKNSTILTILIAGIVIVSLIIIIKYNPSSISEGIENAIDDIKDTVNPSSEPTQPARADSDGDGEA